jgi:hypothetical protein
MEEHLITKPHYPSIASPSNIAGFSVATYYFCLANFSSALTLLVGEYWYGATTAVTC